MRNLGAVRSLQTELQYENIDVLLVNAQDEIGRKLARRYAFRITPTYVLFDAVGTEIWRGHSTPSKNELLQHVLTFNEL